MHDGNRRYQPSPSGIISQFPVATARLNSNRSTAMEVAGLPHPHQFPSFPPPPPPRITLTAASAPSQHMPIHDRVQFALTLLSFRSSRSNLLEAAQDEAPLVEAVAVPAAQVEVILEGANEEGNENTAGRSISSDFTF